MGERIGYATFIAWDYGKRRKGGMDAGSFSPYRAHTDARTAALVAEHKADPEKFLRGYSPRTVEIREAD